MFRYGMSCIILTAVFGMIGLHISIFKFLSIMTLMLGLTSLMSVGMYALMFDYNPLKKM